VTRLEEEEETVSERRDATFRDHRGIRDHYVVYSCLSKASVPRLTKASWVGFPRYIHWMYFARHQSVMFRDAPKVPKLDKPKVRRAEG